MTMGHWQASHRHLQSLHVQDAAFISRLTIRTFSLLNSLAFAKLHMYVPSTPSLPSRSPSLPTQHKTEPNSMGLYHVYPTRPTPIPGANYSLPDLVDAPTLA